MQLITPLEDWVNPNLSNPNLVATSMYNDEMHQTQGWNNFPPSTEAFRIKAPDFPNSLPSEEGEIDIITVFQGWVYLEYGYQPTMQRRVLHLIPYVLFGPTSRYNL